MSFESYLGSGNLDVVGYLDISYVSHISEAALLDLVSHVLSTIRPSFDGLTLHAQEKLCSDVKLPSISQLQKADVYPISDWIRTPHTLGAGRTHSSSSVRLAIAAPDMLALHCINDCNVVPAVPAGTARSHDNFVRAVISMLWMRAVWGRSPGPKTERLLLILFLGCQMLQQS